VLWEAIDKKSGTTTIKYLEKNFAVRGIVLSAEETAEIRKVIDSAFFHGSRYPDL
jgi:aryl-alcohol dehydrogenase-like predicted oxidoreductase